MFFQLVLLHRRWVDTHWTKTIMSKQVQLRDFFNTKFIVSVVCVDDEESVVSLMSNSNASTSEDTKKRNVPKIVIDWINLIILKIEMECWENWFDSSKRASSDWTDIIVKRFRSFCDWTRNAHNFYFFKTPALTFLYQSKPLVWRNLCSMVL